MMQNNYYRFLNLPFEFNMPLPHFPGINHLNIRQRDIPENFTDWLSDLGLMVHHGEIFRKTPGVYPKQIHVDGYNLDDHVKINFIINNNGSIMRWWKVKPGFTYRKDVTVANTKYIYALEEHCELVESVELTRPALINAGQLHDVFITAGTRYAFSFHIKYKNKNNIPMSEAPAIFKDYIVS